MWHIDPSYVSLKLRSASHARLVACSRAIASGESTIRRSEGGLPGSAQIHVASIQPMHFIDSGSRLEVRGTPASRGKGSCGARVQVSGRECAAQRDRIN
jgi:hypothetical protein